MEIYVHVPFCVRKCPYCDFFSVPAGQEAKDRYFEELSREIREKEAPDRLVTSVFFGGGTPSSVPEERISGILELLKERFDIKKDAEITLEANPGTLNEKKLEIYRASGFNRLSLGLQSADNALLKRLGRIHTYEDFEHSFYMAREAGFDNISADMISGIPGDTPGNLEKGLEKVLSLRPEHLSVYSLIIEENTPFYTLYGPSGTESSWLPDEDEERSQVKLTKRVLESHGYCQYEISNFALPGFSSSHNTGYWTQEMYLGYGAAAASFIRKDGGWESAFRIKNREVLRDYLKGYEEYEELSKEDLMAEFMILGLRMVKGVNDDTFIGRYGVSFFERYGKVLDKYQRYGVLERDGNTVRLTNYGQDVCNILFEEFL